MATYNAGAARAVYSLDILEFEKSIAAIKRSYAELGAAKIPQPAAPVAPTNTQALDRAQQQAAISAQRLATEQQRTAKATTDASRADQQLAKDTANAAAAQDRASVAALKRAEAEKKAASATQNGGNGPALPRTFAGVTSGGLDAIKGGLGAVGVAVGAAQLVQGTVEITKLGATALQTSQRFNQLAAAAGQSGDQILAALKKASGGQINDLNLQLAANRANLLGVATNADQLATLMEIARDRAQSLGTTASDAFNDLVVGLGRGSPLILDNLGILVDIKAANEKYAASVGKTVTQLSEADKKIALINQVVADGKSKLLETGGAAETAAGNFAALQTGADNAQAALGKLIAVQVAPWAKGVGEALGFVSDGLSALAAAPTKILDLEGAIATNATSFDTYQAKIASANTELGKINSAIIPLTQAQFDFAKSLIATGTSSEQAIAKARGLGQELGTISSAQDQLTRSGDLSAESANKLAQRLSALVGAGGPAGATAAALADGYVLGSIGAEQLVTALGQLESAHTREANASALAAQRTEERRTVNSKASQEAAAQADAIAAAGRRVAEGLSTQEQEIARLIVAYPELADQAGPLIAEQARLAQQARDVARAFGEQRIASQLTNTLTIAKPTAQSPGKTGNTLDDFLGNVARAKQTQDELNKTTLEFGTAAQKSALLQADYNKAVKQFGQDSPEAIAAQRELLRLQKQGQGGGKGISATERADLKLLASDEARLAALKQEQAALGNSQGLKAKQIAGEILDLESKIAKAKQDQNKASIDAQLNTVRDAQKRLLEEREIAGLKRAIAQGNLTGEQRTSADLRLREIDLERQQRANQIDTQAQKAGNALPTAPQLPQAPANLPTAIPALPTGNPPAIAPPVQPPGPPTPTTINVQVGSQTIATAIIPDLLNVLRGGGTVGTLSGAR